MTRLKKNQRICSKGHKYYKSSDCAVCPICENERKPAADFLATISAPARRALEREGINTLIKLSKRSEKEILQFHGIGFGSMPALRTALNAKGLSFAKNK